MATQRYEGTVGTSYKLYLDISETNNIDSNTSTIGYSVTFYIPSGYYQYTNGNIFSLNINGSQIANTASWGKIYLNTGESIVLASGSFTYSHNSDGSGSFPFSVRFAQSQRPSYDTTISGTHTCTPIPRASSASITSYSGYIGDPMTISITRASTSFTHTLYHDFLVGSWTQFATGVATSYTFTPDSSTISTWLNLMPNAAKASGRILVRTMNGSSIVGDTILYFDGTAKSTVAPSVSSVSYAEANTSVVPSATFSGIYIQTKSKVLVTVSASTANAYGASISSCAIKIGSSSYNASISQSGTTWTCTATSGVLSSSGDIEISATVTDSRGRTATGTATVTVTAYSPPNVSGFKVIRCDSAGTESDEGTFAKITATNSYTSLNGKNTYSCSVKYTDSSGTSKTVSYTTTSVSAIISSINADLTYDFVMTVTDYWGTDTAKVSISTAFTLVDYYSTGKGLSFGKVATSDGFECNLDATFLKPLVKQSYHYCLNYGGTAGTSGYCLMAQIKIIGTYPNAPIKFEFAQRTRALNMFVYVRFANTNTTDPDLSKIVYFGQNFGAYIVKSATSTWDLYVKKSGTNDQITLVTWSQPIYNADKCVVSFPKTFVTALPDGYTEASPSDVTVNGLTVSGAAMFSSGLTVSSGDIAFSGTDAEQRIYFSDCGSSSLNMHIYKGSSSSNTAIGLRNLSSGASICRYSVDNYLELNSITYMRAGLVVSNSSYATADRIQDIRYGSCTLSSSGETTVTFVNPMNSACSVYVFLTPITSSDGVIAGKVRSASHTGFTATIGGDGYPNGVDFKYFALGYF